MPAAKYDAIYRDLREEIENQRYEYQSMLPSEHQLIRHYGCSRNTVRRALQQLAEDGYVQIIHGKGAVVLFRRKEQAEFLIGGIENLREAAARNRLELKTKVIFFAELLVEERIQRRTDFPIGAEIYYLQRLRYLDGEALILDHNYFLKSIVRNLTREIAEGSVYEYMEGVLGETIVTTKRKYTVERITEIDGKYMDMKDYNCLAVVSSHTYNKDGVMFEYTQSRHRPDRFAFYEQAKRLKYGASSISGAFHSFH